MGLVLIAISMIAGPVHATGMWNFDTKHGTYTTAEVGIGGDMNWRAGILYSPAGYAKGTIDTQLPSGHNLTIEYLFEWVDLNHQVQTQTANITTNLYIAGDFIRIDCTSLPSAVYEVIAECRTAWNSTTPDTAWASASLPAL